jgi:acetyl esterase/lipase
MTESFAQLWPDVQAVLKSEVLGAAKGASPKHLTFAGHSIGGAMATLLSYAVRRRVEARAGTTEVSARCSLVAGTRAPGGCASSAWAQPCSGLRQCPAADPFV